jgi:hypothetical protein
VRQQNIKHCCKRVRTWRAQAVNPLLQSDPSRRIKCVSYPWTTSPEKATSSRSRHNCLSNNDNDNNRRDGRRRVRPPATGAPHALDERNYGARPRERRVSQTKERRIHLTVILATIVDIYERFLPSCDHEIGLAGAIESSFPQYVANSLLQKASGGRYASSS